MNTTGGSLGSGSFLSKDGQRSFDIRSESDVISLLKYVHQSPFEAELKNHLRDLIFAYRQSMSSGDLSLVCDAFVDIGVVVVRDENEVPQTPPVAKEVVKTSVNSLGISRPKPRFAASPAPVASSKIAVQTQEDVPVSQPQDWPEAKKIPVTDVSKAVVAPMETPQPAPAATVIAEVAPVDVPEVVPPVVQAPVVSSVNPTTRIQEIKREVNQKVGNPVNLISINNEIGREYMNSLLDAMKKVNGGSQDEIAQALARLEKAFEQVKTVDTSNLSTSKNEEVASEEPARIVSSGLGTSAVGIQTPNYTQTPEPVSSAVAPMMEAAPEVAPQVEVPLQETPRMSSVKEKLQAQSVAETVTPMSMPQEGAMHSIAKEKQLQDLLRLNQLKGAKAANDKFAAEVSGMDPLLTPEVTSGLDQLLSEWSLFKSSGIFGTGPSGNDHPLYTKISPLTMAAVIAGRFEGATPQIKQSITDYMNGWRYEEGIVHEHGETFEHYLRRVVRHILSKQKMR